MTTVIAYVLIIIPISLFVVTAIVLLTSLVLGICWSGLSYFVPDDKKGGLTPFIGLVTGFLGECAGFGYAFLVFRLLEGPNSFTVLPLCIAAVQLLRPPIQDLNKARKMAGKHADSESDFAKEMILSLKTLGIGEVFGFVAGILIFGLLL